MGQETGAVLAQKLVDIMKNEYNPEGFFRHPVSGHQNHLCITGGEPLMRHAQNAFLDIYEALSIMPGGKIPETSYMASENLPSSVTWETNGTQALSDDFLKLVASPLMKPEAFFSVSPKLWSVAGEKGSKAIKPDVVKQYYDVSGKGQLKFVVGHRKEQWEELDDVVSQMRAAGVKYPVWIMPVGAREEEQKMDAGAVAKMAFERGYNVAGRMHVYLFGNAIGT
jgi:organic radical activating enzyme